jgi:mannose-6-phosphate isomerase-like protein (cupin superfamily)
MQVPPLQRMSPVHRPAGAGSRCNILGVEHTTKESSSENAAGLLVVEALIPPGVGLPLHKHANEDEFFYILAGAIHFEGEGIDGAIRVEPGGSFSGPRGLMHSFLNKGPGDAKVLITVTPGAAAEKMFEELANVSASTPDMQEAGVKVIAICAGYGVVFAPPQQ